MIIHVITIKSTKNQHQSKSSTTPAVSSELMTPTSPTSATSDDKNGSFGLVQLVALADQLLFRPGMGQNWVAQETYKSL